MALPHHPLQTATKPRFSPRFFTYDAKHTINTLRRSAHGGCLTMAKMPSDIFDKGV